MTMVRDEYTDSLATPPRQLGVEAATPDASAPHLDPGSMTVTDWRENVQAFINSPADSVFGLGRTMDGERLTSHLQPPQHTWDDDGLPATGLVFLLADAAVGRAVVRCIAADEVVVTNSLRVSIHRVPFSDGPHMQSDSGDAHIFHGTAAANVDLTTEGHLVATASGRFTVLKVDDRAGGRVAGPTASPASFDARSVSNPGTTPIDRVLGMTTLDRGHASRTAGFVASPDLANERGGLHGGVGALVAERVCHDLLRDSTSTAFEATEMSATFLRPVQADNSLVTVDATIVHGGRRLAVARATVRTPDGSPAVSVEVTSASWTR